MDKQNEEVLKSLNPNRVLIPVGIGLAAVLYLILSNDKIDFAQVASKLVHADWAWLIAAFVVLAVRDLGYMYRIRELTEKKLTFGSSFFVVLLWEFASAITPSVVGGTAVAVFIINREGVAFGRSLAYVMLTAVLDNMFFVLASLSVIFFLPFQIFPEGADTIRFMSQDLPLQAIFVISVSLIGFYTLFMSFGLFFTPQLFKRFLVWCTGFSLLKRFRKAAEESGDEMILASESLRGMSLGYWLKATISTAFIWSARYMMLNCLIAAFVGISAAEHLLIFSRQIIMWIVMLISPTPGSSGTAEWAFSLFFDQFFTGGFVLIVAVLWRLFTYYAYLLAGVVIIPRWIKRVFMKKKPAVK